MNEMKYILPGWYSSVYLSSVIYIYLLSLLICRYLNIRKKFEDPFRNWNENFD